MPILSYDPSSTTNNSRDRNPKPAESVWMMRWLGLRQAVQRNRGLHFGAGMAGRA